MSTVKSKKRDKVKHSATGKTKLQGQARKGGGGGKGTWGRAGDEHKYDDDNVFLDRNDPNYDVTEQDGFYFSSVPEKTVEKEFAASIQIQKTFKDKIRSAAREYFKAQDKSEFETCISEAKMRDSLLYHEIVKEVVKIALDKGDKELHAASDLLRHLTKKKVLESRHVYKGFYHLFNQIAEITIDVPKAKEKLMYIIECALLFGLTQKQIDHLRDTLKHCSDQKTLRATKEKILTMVQEYLDCEDIEELSKCFKELKMPFMGYELVKRSISISMDRGARERELVSRMISELSGTHIPREEIAKGFEVFLQRVEDLHMDVPNVLELLSGFLARAIADEAIAPSFLLQAHIQEGDGGFSVIQQSQKFLKRKNATVRLLRVWGPSKGDSIKVLKKRVKDMVLEYFSSDDLNEVLTLAKDIPPHFRHEIVKRSFVLALDKNERELQLCEKLLRKLDAAKVMWKSQLREGFERIEANIDDIALDNVKAKDHFKSLKEKMKSVLPQETQTNKKECKDNKDETKE